MWKNGVSHFLCCVVIEEVKNRWVPGGALRLLAVLHEDVTHGCPHVIALSNDLWWLMCIEWSLDYKKILTGDQIKVYSGQESLHERGEAVFQHCHLVGSFYQCLLLSSIVQFGLTHSFGMVYKGRFGKAFEAYLLQKVHCSLQFVLNWYLIHCTKVLFTLFIL